ncbi:MAG: hypothetical protein KAU95_02395 [Candidatus Aenigmarchaeota archaeon]|nr:hypothetical protein [Candidatus Aenigmarchaeota archaeon]
MNGEEYIIKRNKNMGIIENKTERYREFSEFIFLSIFIIIGFFILYLSKVNLTSLIILQAGIMELFILGVQEKSVLDVLLSTFSGIFIATISLIVFCLCLSLLSVKKLHNTKYLLALPILGCGFLFNFSIMFLFFALGFFISCLYAMPLGETYYKELKKWKKFRVGSNAVSKSLTVLFFFIFLGSFISLITDNSYQQQFFDTTKSSLENVINAEVSGMGAQGKGPATEEIINRTIEREMIKIRKDYPNMTEEEYIQVEEDIRKDIEDRIITEEGESGMNITAVVSDALGGSAILNAFLAWFPVMMSISIWFTLEFIKSVLLSPVSGVFSFIWFSVFRVPMEGESRILQPEEGTPLTEADTQNSEDNQDNTPSSSPVFREKVNEEKQEFTDNKRLSKEQLIEEAIRVQEEEERRKREE